MLRPQGEQLRDRLVPTVVRLVRQSGNQVEADILEASVAKNLGRAIDIVRRCMRPAAFSSLS